MIWDFIRIKSNKDITVGIVLNLERYDVLKIPFPILHTNLRVQTLR